MGILDAPSYSPRKARLGSLYARLASSNTLAIPAVAAAADIPTVAWNTTSAFASGYQHVGPQSGLVTEVGSRGVWNASFGRLPTSGLSGLDFYHDGTTTLEIQCNTNAASQAEGFWIWVNGSPVALLPDTTNGPNISGTYYVLLTFAAAARRRIEFFAPSLVANWYGVRSGNGALITPAPRRPVVAFVGDSFWGGSAATNKLLGGAFLMSRLLGVEGYSQSIGGTGYVAGSSNQFGHASRVAAVALANPELIVMQGSLNDDGLSGIQAAATAAFTAYATACPNAKIIVFGPQPSAATVTIGASRQSSIAAVAAAAAAAPNVIAFHDMCGTLTGVPAAFSTSTTYNDGDLVTSLGSVWKLVNNGSTSTGSGASNAPGTAAKWVLQTYVYTGTGKVGTVVGDGTRDTYLYSDGVHPMPAASAALAIREASIIRADLQAAAV